MKTFLRGVALGFLALMAWLAPGRVLAQSTYTWTGGGTVSNSWNDVGNWSPTPGAGGPTGTPTLSTGTVTNVNSAPSAGDTVNLNDTGGVNRTVVYDSSAIYGSGVGSFDNGALGTLNIAQTGVGTNSLTITKNLWIKNGVTLGTTGGGVAEIEVAGGSFLMAGVNGVSGGFSNGSSPYGVTLNAGGLLLLDGGGDLGDQNNSASGNLLISGGMLQAGIVGASGTNIFDPSSGTMTSGKIEVEQGVTLRFFNNFIATGGQIALGSGATAGTVFMGGSVEVLLNTTLATGLAFNLNNNAALDSIYADNQLANVTLNLQASDGATTTTNKLIGLGSTPSGSLLLPGSFQFNSAGGPLQVGQINMFLNGAAAATSSLILQLATDVTVLGSNTIVAQNTDPSSTPTLGIDANGHTLDLSANTNGWKASAEGASLTTWNLTTSAANGKIKAASFNLNQAHTAVNVGSGLVLQATGGNGTTSDLGSTNGGTISTGSTFVYAGNAIGRGVSAANLVSNRAVGAIQVQSGVLNLNQTALTSADVTVNGGSLDLNGTGVGTLTLASGNFTMSSGTLLLSLGTTFDQIVGSGGTFSLTGGTLAFDLGTGFNYANTYALFSGFSSGSSSGITFSGLTGYTASLSSGGVLSFNAVPEPPPLVPVALGTGFVLVAARWARRQRLAA